MSAIQKIFFRNKSNYLFKLKKFYTKNFSLKAANLINQNLTEEIKKKNITANFGITSDNFRKQGMWYENICKSASKLIVSSFPEYKHIIFPPMCRRVSETKDEVPWHQDNAYMRQLGNKGHQDIITIFVYLSQKSTQRSKLQFLDYDIKNTFNHDNNGNVTNSLQVTEKTLPNGNIVTPDIDIGDALIFGDKTLHKTTNVNKNLDRHSIEFRVTNSNSIKPNRDYFDLTTYHWIKI